MEKGKNEIDALKESAKKDQNIIADLLADLDEEKKKNESLSKDIETYKSAFMRYSAECDSLKDKLKSLKTIINLL